MYQDSSEQAAKYLREAVPLMVKHQIPPTPYNYALWYSYVSNRDPQLNSAIDNTLASHGTCPSSATEELFRNHIISGHVADNESAQQTLKAIISELRTQVDEALLGAEDFHQLLEDSSQSLENEPETLDIGALISSLTQGTQHVSESTRAFRDRITETQKEVEQLRKELKRSQQEAERDPLTGLFNRRYLERYAQQLMEQGSCGDRFVVLVDIDHFKSFNDSYGHLVGDKVIQRVAALLNKAVIGDEVAVRFGGEEFLMLIKGSDIQKVVERAEKVRQLLQSVVLKDRRAEKDIRRITASFGIAGFRRGESRADWIERADKALYQAKEQGRNRVIVAASG